MVVTKAPSEPWELVRRTLEAMLAQHLPHDTWLAEEAPGEDTRRWCQSHGVQVSTRQGVSDYHRPTRPRRTRCREGNLAFFYDPYGYDRYDIVAQPDADLVCPVQHGAGDRGLGVAAQPGPAPDPPQLLEPCGAPESGGAPERGILPIPTLLWL